MTRLGAPGEAVTLLPPDDGEFEEREDELLGDSERRPAPRLWCFLRTSPHGAQWSAVPRQLCTAIVYQGVKVAWRDAQANLDVVSEGASTFARVTEV